MPNPNETPVAPPVDGNTPAASPPAGDPAGVESSGAPTAVETESARALREIKAQHGREMAQTRREAAEAQRQVVAMNSQVQELTRQVQAQGAHLTERAQKERDAHLASLPPEKRTQEELRLLREQVRVLAANRAAPAAPAPTKRPLTQQEIDAYTARRAQELIAATNQEFGLTGDAVLTGEEQELDWDSEDAYKGSIRALAQTRKNGGSPVAKKDSAAETAAKAKEDMRREILAELGVGGSNAAKPTGGDGNTSLDEMQKINFGYQSRGGMVAQRKKMEALRDEARTARSRP